MTALLLSISLIGAYLIGSIPFAYIYGKIFQSLDIRQHGSGNIGATNVMRVFGKKAGVLVLLLDILKGFLPVFVIQKMLQTHLPTTLAGSWDDMLWLPVLTGIFAILGHSFTIFLSFKGGRGVATSAGVFIALSPYTFIGAIILFLIIVSITRYVSLGSMIAAISIALGNLFFFDQNIYIKSFTILVAIFIIYTHRSNIKRLLSGTENKLNSKQQT